VTKIELIQQAFRKGYEHAQKSFSLLTGQKILPGTMHIGFNYGVNILSEPKIMNNLTILQTEIFGESEGECYLILTPKEREYLCENNQQKAIYNGVGDLAFLLELDNIISAAVVTEISNVFDISVYGDVPRHMNITNWRVFVGFLQQKLNSKFFIVQMKFFFENTSDINPSIVFRLNKDLLSSSI
jgi:hypothetical protein